MKFDQNLINQFKNTPDQHVVNVFNAIAKKQKIPP
jgi:hypothetical protein